MTNIARQPVVGVGAIVIHKQQVLLVKRGKPPNMGQWAIPGGRLRWGETLQQGAEREVLEETGITIRAGEVVFTFEHISNTETDIGFHYVVLDLQAEYVTGTPQAADDAAAAAWYGLEQLPLQQLNATTLQALQPYILDQNGSTMADCHKA